MHIGLGVGIGRNQNAGGGAAPVEPPSFVTLMYDFSDSSTMTLTGDLVDDVTPIVGTAVATGVTTTRPYYSADIGASGGIRFQDVTTGVSDDHLTIPTSVAFDSRAGSVFVVTRRGADAVNSNLNQVMFHATDIASRWAIYSGSASKVILYDGANTTVDLAVPSGTSIQYMIGGATNSYVGSDGTLITRGAAFTLKTGVGARIGKWTSSSFPWHGDMVAWLYVDSEVTSTERDEVLEYLRTKYSAAPSTEDTAFIFDGDSITEGIQSDNPQLDPHATDFSFPARWENLRTTIPRFYNVALGGQSLSNQTAAPSVKDMLKTAKTMVTNRVVLGLWGHNDIQGGRTAAQFSTDLDTWIAAIRAEDSGAIIGHATILPSSTFTAGEEIIRGDINTNIMDATGSGPDLDFYIDAASISGITKVDNVHPDSAGYLAMAQGIQDEMEVSGNFKVPAEFDIVSGL